MTQVQKQIFISLVTILAAGVADLVLAQGGGGGDISSMATKVKTEATSVATLMTIAAYVAGVGFALGGVLQFKAHKDNPQNTPLSKPVVMIVVAACLLFLPTVMTIAGGSLFESGQSSQQYTGGP